MHQKSDAIRVVVEGLERSDKAVALGEVVQKSVLAELARLDIEGVAIRFPRDWVGLLVRELQPPQLDEMGLGR